MDWEEEFVRAGLSERARRVGAAYAGPGAGNDIPQSERPQIGFTGGLPDPSLLPADELAAATAVVLRDHANSALQYGGAQGWEGLREWLASHWSGVEGVDLSPAHYTLTNGSAGALLNVCETFCDAGDVAIVEAPSFPGSIRAIRAVTPRLESVPVDADGIDVDALEELLAGLARAGARVRLLYVIPNYHNPTGSTLTLERRHRLLELCDRHGVLVVEDDAYGELPFEDPPPPSLFSLAGGRGVVKIGTFSKIVAPGLRVGWCQALPRTVDALVATRHDMGISPLLIRVLARFAADGLEQHIPRIRAAYARKCATMLDGLAANCDGRTTWNQPSGGFFVWMTLADEIDALALADAARDEGVVYVSGRVFYAELTAGEGPRSGWGPGDSRFIRLAFSYTAEDQISEGIRRLGAALERAPRA